MISIAEIGIVMPIATSIAWHRDLGCPTRWSPESNRNEPIAMAGPVAAMITGAGNVRHRTDSSKPPASMPSATFGASHCHIQPARSHRRRALARARVQHLQSEAAAETPLVACDHSRLGRVLLGP